MKNKDFAGLGKQLARDLPEFSVKGPMVFVRPIEHNLRRLYFEGSSFDAKSFYVWIFFLPLCVPTKQVIFNLGKRLRKSDGGDRWSSDAPNLAAQLSVAVKREALPFLASIASSQDTAELAAEFAGTGDPYALQAVAYSLARCGDIGRAKSELQRLVGMLDIKIPWQREIAERAERLRTILTVSPVDAQHQLAAWETETVRNLGLEKFRGKR
jgi:hypothetical protein